MGFPCVFRSLLPCPPDPSWTGKCPNGSDRMSHTGRNTYAVVRVGVVAWLAAQPRALGLSGALLQHRVYLCGSHPSRVAPAPASLIRPGPSLPSLLIGAQSCFPSHYHSLPTHMLKANQEGPVLLSLAVRVKEQETLACSVTVGAIPLSHAISQENY